MSIARFSAAHMSNVSRLICAFPPRIGRSKFQKIDFASAATRSRKCFHNEREVMEKFDLIKIPTHGSKQYHL